MVSSARAPPLQSWIKHQGGPRRRIVFRAGDYPPSYEKVLFAPFRSGESHPFQE